MPNRGGCSLATEQPPRLGFIWHLTFDIWHLTSDIWHQTINDWLSSCETSHFHTLIHPNTINPLYLSILALHYWVYFWCIFGCIGVFFGKTDSRCPLWKDLHSYTHKYTQNTPKIEGSKRWITNRWKRKSVKVYEIKVLSIQSVKC